jgi:hypothetical protein
VPVHEAPRLREVPELAAALLGWSARLCGERVTFDEYQLDELGEVAFTFSGGRDDPGLRAGMDDLTCA